MTEDEKLYSLPKEMGLLLGLATSEDMTVASITIGWLVRQVFEANCTVDFDATETVIDPAFKRRLDAHIEWMNALMTEPT